MVENNTQQPITNTPTTGVSTERSNMEKLIGKIKDLRLRMSRLIKYLNNRQAKPRYVALAFTSLELSRMWLGKVLGKLDTPYPYPESTNPESKVIKKATDTDAVSDLEVPEEYKNDPVAELKLLRGVVTVYTEEIKDIFSHYNHDIYPEATFAYEKIMETNMWLGMALGELREEK